MNWSEKFKRSGYVSSYQPSKPVVERCKACGLRKRGVNHDEGSHHKARAK